MTSTVLSVRIPDQLLARLREHAARRGVSVQDYVLTLLVREDFDERFRAAVEETDRFYRADPEPGESQRGVTPHTT
ncbi:ribbon-helix-helix protein, CopG family [Streptomyces alkaliterrae]|uniref:Ribbon-helix-helix protein, CopG family n=1 Tax=Streptomyces alkaliterrae TaxID=2213162 RepID=A0A5P0YU40_9ACTN|nr:ribbon-helix-helix protein, CopG family [Streptomyces alkaliterrae]MBB1253680.1 ribbon-helix-helix protein, CopG family [Streptomyces alkaliterrae]MBB1260304.1 ribbon-helix-helix protein, CopG family [Streptomyces alkaliterrae]MQS01989.1 ribbon-helix-helix protein, CopG family [Streptomyces alkaliterrae]